jgi:hypothetical protein
VNLSSPHKRNNIQRQSNFGGTWCWEMLSWKKSKIKWRG